MMEQKVTYDHYRLSLAERAALLSGYLLLCGAIGWLFYHTVFAALPFLLFWPFAKKLYRAYRIEGRRQKLLLQFKEAMHSISGSVEAGVSLEQSIGRAVSELRQVLPEDADMMQELRQIQYGLRMNVTIEDLFDDLGVRSGLKEIRTFADVIRTAKRSGGNLIHVIAHTTGTIAAKIELEREIAAELAGKKLEARMTAIMLPGILIYMNLGMGEMMEMLYEGILGRAVMTGTLVLYLGSVAWSEKIVRIRV